VKSFGSKTAAHVGRAHREPFQFTFLRDDEPETHEFNAVAKPDLVGLTRVMVLINTAPERATAQLLAMIPKGLDNSDGTPAKWEPIPVADGYGEHGEPGAKYIVAPSGPQKGGMVPAEHAAQFEAFDAGSSRRRWNALLDDDDIAVDIADVMALFEWMVSLVADRPTVPSS
jgi:hypothetical protein